MGGSEDGEDAGSSSSSVQEEADDEEFGDHVLAPDGTMSQATTSATSVRKPHSANVLEKDSGNRNEI